MSKYDDLILKKYLERSPVNNFFYNLFASPKPDVEKAQDRELLLWTAKYFIGFCYFKALFYLDQKYHALISFITRYYPFSLLFQDRLLHHQMKNWRFFLGKLERLSKKAKTPIFILRGAPIGIMYELEFVPLFNANERNLRKLERVLRKYTDIYVRRREKNFYLIIPLAS